MNITTVLFLAVLYYVIYSFVPTCWFVISSETQKAHKHFPNTTPFLFSRIIPGRKSWRKTFTVGTAVH